MANDLIPDPTVLDYLPGAPFTEAEVDAAVAAIRNAAGWHIAPERTEVVELDVNRYEQWLRLPTLKLVSVNQISDADTAELIDPSSYRVSTHLNQVKRRSWWPCGYAAVAVDATHGYPSCPPELYAVIADAVTMARRDQGLRSVQIDDFQQTFGQGVKSSPVGVSSVLSDYTLSDQLLRGIGIA